MKKIWKKVLASVLAVTLCAGAFMATNWNTVSAEDAVNPADSLEVSGASIRFINSDTAVDGIRFAVRMKADVFAKLTDAQKKNYHLLVMPTALLGTDGVLEKGETYEYTVGEATKYAKAQDIAIDWANADDDTENNVNYKVVRIYLNQINASYYMTDITARAYYQDGISVPVYSAPQNRSYYMVADAALEQDAAGFTAVQRDALLGVKYEKTGTWDYVDGKLVTNGSFEHEDGNKTHPMVLDRKAVTTSKSYIIETSYRVGYDDNTPYEEAATEIDNGSKGIIFGYNEDTGSYYVLDIRYRVHASLGRGFWAHIRYYNGTGWDVNVISHTVALEPGMYDFRITVDAETEGETVVYVEAKKPGEGSYATLFPSTANLNNTWKNGRTITGTRIGFTSQLADERLVFNPEIKVYNGGVQTRGNETLPVDTTLNITEEATTIEGSFVYDYRTELCTRVRCEGILLGDDSRNGYFFHISDHQGQKAFFISLKKGSNGNWSDVNAGAGFNDLPKRSLVTDKGLTLSDNDEILVDYKIVVTKNALNQNVFTIDYSLNYGDKVIYEKAGWECVDTNATQTTITDLYLHSEDGGSPIKDTAVNNHTCGDGKTIYYPITVSVEPEVDSTVTISNQGTIKVNKTLSITAEPTTIEGSFVYDYRTCTYGGCASVRQEGIVFGDAEETGYFFNICNHATRSAFFISLKKGSTSTGSWSDVISGAGFNDLPLWSNASDKGLNLSDNDPILVKYKILVTKNASNQNVFVIDYSLNYGDTVIYEKTGWECVDTNATQTTITNIYLRSQDGGSPIKDTAVNNHTCGDGQTIYYPIKVNGVKVITE